LRRLALLELAKRGTVDEAFPFAIFTFMSCDALFIGLLVTPALRRIRSTRGAGALKAGHWPRSRWPW
jgi:hypothetical protein